MSTNQKPRDWSVLSVLGFYDVRLLRKPLKEMTGEEALLQFQFLSSLHAHRKHAKGTSLGLSKVMTKRMNALGQMLVQGFSSFNYSGKVLDPQKPERVIVIGGGQSTANLVALAAIASLKDLAVPAVISPDPVFIGLTLSDAGTNTDLSSGKRFGLAESKKPEKANDNHGKEFTSFLNTRSKNV